MLRPAANQALPGLGLQSHDAPMARVLHGLQGHKGEEDPSEEGDNEITSILKKGNHSTAIYISIYKHTHKLTFLDVCNYLPFGCAKYLSTYKGPTCEGGKSFFPYKYVDNLDRLHDPLPPNKSFYS